MSIGAGVEPDIFRQRGFSFRRGGGLKLLKNDAFVCYLAKFFQTRSKNFLKRGLDSSDGAGGGGCSP